MQVQLGVCIAIWHSIATGDMLTHSIVTIVSFGRILVSARMCFVHAALSGWCNCLLASPVMSADVEYILALICMTGDADYGLAST